MATITDIPARAILEAAPDAVLLVSSVQGNIIWANRRAGEMFGCAPDALVGASIESLLPEQLRKAHVKHRERYLADPTTRPMGRGIRLVARRTSGALFRVEVSLSPVQIESEIQVICVVRDLSEYLRV